MAKDETEKWRGKYYDSLAELEQKEKGWRRTDELLRHAVLRLSLAADSSDAELNRQLDKLRRAIRRGSASAELETLIDALSERIMHLDEARRSQPQPPSPREILHELLDALPIPRGLGRRAKALRKQIDAGGEHAALIEEVAGLITETIAWEAEARREEAQPEAGRGLLGRLFHAQESAPAEEGEEAQVEEPPALGAAKAILRQLIAELLPAPAREPLSAQVAQASREQVLQQLARELAAQVRGEGETPAPEGEQEEGIPPLHEVLIQLLERLTIPQDLSPKVEALKQHLARGLAPERVDPALSAIADLIAAMRGRVQREKEEIENFLKQLTENLQELDINIQHNFSHHRETVQEGRELDAAVQVQMRGIEDSIETTHDLSLLKGAIQERIGTIRSHMEHFRQNEEERIARAEAEVRQLSTRLNQVEHEADGLRNRLRKERHNATIDPLTGIPNRLAYDERMAQEYARWKRYFSPLVLAVWDVDHFKRINDGYGHQAGDKVLRVIAERLREQLREADFVARYGGEEFVALLPETDLDGAMEVAEKVRTCIEGCEFHYRDKPVKITVSCGLAQFRENDDPDAVFARADAALYRAKETGRNRCLNEQDL